MSYQLGIDLGTTYTAAAVYRDGAATIFTLGSRAAAIPSVVLIRSDGTVLTGDAAERRAMSEPERVVREFKRRLGDTTPIIVGGAPHSAESLTAHLLRSVCEAVNAREGGPPTRIVITHPANWGDYKRSLLDQAVQLAGVEGASVDYLTEPEAAALSYAAQERVAAGEVVAVYDLGGGTFDAAVLRRTASGFAIAGRPEGIERLGGIDFDAAVFAHVTGGLASAMTELDHDDPAALAAVARLRLDCILAKEALSSDTDASIPVLLPTLQTEVRITRQEFETLIRPPLMDSIESMKRAIRSAGLELDDVSRVLLVGGSSRIPLISLLVTSELGRPVAVDAHPKHAVAIGAAFAASGQLGQAPETAPPTTAPAGVDPNMTVVAPAHLLNPTAPPADRSGSRRALPVEGPATPRRALPVEDGRPAMPAPAPRPAADGRPAPGRGLPGTEDRPRRRALPVEGESPLGRALPVEKPPPSPDRSRPPITPDRTSALPAGHDRGSDAGPTSLYREPVQRTEVYPGGQPPGFDPVPAAPAAKGRRSKLGMVAVFLVALALIVVVALVAQTLR